MMIWLRYFNVRSKADRYASLIYDTEPKTKTSTRSSALVTLTRPTTSILLTDHWPFLSVCLSLTSSLESASAFSPTTTLSLTHSYTRHLILHCWLTTAIIHHSVAVSLQAQNLPVPQIIFTLDSILPSSGLTPWFLCPAPFLLSISVCFFSFFSFYCFWHCAVD